MSSTVAVRSLAVAGRATVPGHPQEPVSSQVAELALVAGLIRDAAAGTAAAGQEPAVASLAEDVRKEVVALSAGLASAARGSRAVGLPGEPA
jgi:hypothetical protein